MGHFERKGEKRLEEIKEEMKERDREERVTVMKVKKQKKLHLVKKNQQQVRQINEYTRGNNKKKKKKKCTTTRTEFSPYMLVSAPTADRIKLNEKKKKKIGLFTIA